MRIMLVMPGADYSTQDVYRGIQYGLEQNGHTVFEYDLGVQLTKANRGLNGVWKNSGLGDEHRPKRGQIMYEAGKGIYADCIFHEINAVIVVTGDHWHPDHSILLRKASVPLGLLYTESPYYDRLVPVNAGLFDVVWTNERTSVPRLQDAVTKLDLPAQVRYLPSAFHPERHFPLDPDPELPSHDVVFVGTGFLDRIETLEAIDWSGIDLGLYGHWYLLRAPQSVFKREGWVPDVPLGLRGTVLRGLSRAGHKGTSPLWQHLRSGVIPNPKVAGMYRNGKIGLDLRRVSEAYQEETRRVMSGESLGPRAYELAACGAFFLAEYRAEIPDLFGDAIPTFTGPQEAESLIRYYLGRPAERAERAQAALDAVREHSYVKRADQMVCDLRTVMRERSATAIPNGG